MSAKVLAEIVKWTCGKCDTQVVAVHDMPLGSAKPPRGWAISNHGKSFGEWDTYCPVCLAADPELGNFGTSNDDGIGVLTIDGVGVDGRVSYHVAS